MTAQPTEREMERARKLCTALAEDGADFLNEVDAEARLAQALADARAEGMMTGQRQGLAQAKVIAERLHDELNEKMADPEANRGALLDQQLGIILVMEALIGDSNG